MSPVAQAAGFLLFAGILLYPFLRYGGHAMRGVIKTIGIAGAALLVILAGRAFLENDAPEQEIMLPAPQPPAVQEQDVPEDEHIGTSPQPPAPQPSSPQANQQITETIEFAVPFTPQAPFGDWSDPRQQDGCEEASILMAMRWVRGEPLTRDEALNEIFAMSAFEQERYGYFQDRSAEGTAELIRDYFGYTNVSVEHDITTEDITRALQGGNLVITPMDGTRIGNPYYTPPGPERHMLVVKGYDPAVGEFITNDPGTRRGESFRYQEDVFFAAIRDYPSGVKVPITEIRRHMIVIGR